MAEIKSQHVKVSVTVSAGFHSRNFYSATIAATSFRALGVSYATTRECRFAENRTRACRFVDHSDTAAAQMAQQGGSIQRVSMWKTRAKAVRLL